MKNGYKHKTGVYGDSAETYVGRLFWMVKNPNGSLRPDLLSHNGTYKNPRLSIEVKSGREKKGVLVKYQLHYGVTSERDYQEVFGEELPKQEGILEGLINDHPLKGTPEVAYYYNIIDRPDGITSDKLDRPYSSIQLAFGDQHLAPHQFGFWTFVIGRHMRTGEPIKRIQEELIEGMKRDVIEKKSHYRTQKDSQSWQNIHGRDILAIVHNNEAYTTKKGVSRLKLIREHYPESRDLKPIQIPGPNSTTIYILAEPDHTQLFDVQMRGLVEKRAPILEKISRARRRSIPLLKKIVRTRQETSLYENGGIPENQYERIGLTRKEIQRLERLVNWLDKGETILEPEESIPI